MNISQKSLKSGFSMPVFGLGTWEMGGRMAPDPKNDDQADIAAIGKAIKHGIIHIDTAEKYAAGHAEELVGTAIKQYDRKKLFLVTKVAGTNLHTSDVRTSLEKSLTRLGTDYVDLYLIHEPNHNIPLKETMAVLCDLVDEKKIKYIGVSNFSVESMKEAQEYSRYPIVANQVHYNLQCRESEKKGLLDYCLRNDVILIAYRPIEKAMLLETNAPVVEEMAKKYNKTFAQIAINWLVSQKNVVTLSKMRNIKHLEENLGAVDWQMADDDIERLRKEFPGQVDVSAVCPLS
jgi:diketogulonate reductase-like aldo/keto reductase